MDSLEHRLAELEGAEAALVLASGRAATASTMLALLRPGDHLLACTWMRPETRDFFETELPALGVEVTFTSPRDTRGWRRDLRKTTRALFLESPVIENGRPVDLRPPRTLAQELGIALIVDASLATPANSTPLRHGADVVLHDASLLLDGDGVGGTGIVCGPEGVIDEVRRKMERWGAVPHPAARTSLACGLGTLAVRVERMNTTARQVAEWAWSAPGVQRVSYAGLSDDPDHGTAMEWMQGAGPVLVINLVHPGSGPVACHHVTAQLAPLLPGGAGVVTQVRPVAPDGPLRVQVGLEDPAVIIAALDTALTAAVATAPQDHR